jgi:hypothetical protein
MLITFSSSFVLFGIYKENQLDQEKDLNETLLEEITYASKAYLQIVWAMHADLKMKDLQVESLEGEVVNFSEERCLVLLLTADFCTTCSDTVIKLFQESDFGMKKYIIGSQMNINYLKHLRSTTKIEVLRTPNVHNLPFLAFIREEEIVSICPLNKNDYETTEIFIETVR